MTGRGGRIGRVQSSHVEFESHLRQESDLHNGVRKELTFQMVFYLYLMVYKLHRK